MTSPTPRAERSSKKLKPKFERIKIQARKRQSKESSQDAQFDNDMKSMRR